MTNALIIEPRGDREIYFRREFNAPKSLVFTAYSACKHLKKWLGPSYLEIRDCEMDFAPGGKWRMVHVAGDGSEYEFFGEILEVVPNEKIVRTFVFAPFPDAPLTETLTMSESDGVTTIEVTAVHVSKEARDGMLASGMEEGASESYDRLETYLKELSQIA
ncbi:MAG TPA: SRPBCC family protein [Fimbriimonas sp.]|nr:SRPBCC family protein [Fimbriimonas sp.]